MNQARRKLLFYAVGNLNAASTLVSRAFDEEEDCLGNLPDSLQNSERYERINEAASR